MSETLSDVICTFHGAFLCGLSIAKRLLASKLGVVPLSALVSLDN
jgi:uncharacterized protein YrrD